MATEPTKIKQIRVIFPDGLPRGLDPSQDVQLVVRNPTRESPDGKQSRDSNGAAANDRAAEQFPQHDRDGNEASVNHPTAPLPAQNGRKADALVREPAPEPVQPSDRSAAAMQNESSVTIRPTFPTMNMAQCSEEPEAAAADARPPEQSDAVPMPSPHKLSRAEAARENGRKSRGPITPEGKARSSQNALKHGLSSRRVVIGEEEEEEWLELRDACRETLKPVGAIELNYADEFAASRWRLQRCLGIETAIFDQQFAMQKIYRAKECASMDGIDKTGMAFKSAKDDLTALGRYETRIRRSGERALANVLKLQSMRENEPNEPDEPETPDGDMLQLVPSGGESTAQNEPGARSAGGAPDAEVGPYPPTETAEAKRTQAAGYNPAVPLASTFGILPPLLAPGLLLPWSSAARDSYLHRGGH